MLRIHTESRRIYGSPKITRELPKLGLAAHRNTVSRIMQECGIRGKYVRKYRPTTTQSAHALSPDLLKRDFTADGPYKKWLCDITYIPTDEGFLYLAGVMGAWSRSIVGWSMSNTLHATITTDALTMAVKRRSPPIGLVHHSDRGVQYACHACRELLEEHGMAWHGMAWHGMAWHGAEHEPCCAGNCYDNAIDGKPLGDPEEGTRPRSALPHARRSACGNL